MSRIIERIDARLLQEAQAAEAAKIMEATLILAGMRLGDEEIEGLRRRLHMLNITTESSYYRVAVKEGLAKGSCEEARKLILRLGERRFGPPSAEVREFVETNDELDQLERLFDRVIAASNWEEAMDGARE